MPYSVRRISAEYPVVPAVCAAKLAVGGGPGAGDGRDPQGIAPAPAITNAPVTAAISGRRRAPARISHLPTRRENNGVIGFLSQAGSALS